MLKIVFTHFICVMIYYVLVIFTQSTNWTGVFQIFLLGKKANLAGFPGFNLIPLYLEV